MSRKYDEYLREHIGNVQKAGKWLINHGISSHPGVNYILENNLLSHDASKRTISEYGAYDEYFYGKGKDDPDTKEAFGYAWLHHIHRNPHHWQYWVLINDDDGKPKALEMPEEYVYEMIADWWSFSWKAGNLNEIFNWYADHGPKMILHENTRKLVDDTLDQIEKILEAEKDD